MLVTAWALTGVALLFGYAVVRLGVRGVQTIMAGLEMGEWVALIVLTALFVWGEGIRALQRRYMPFVIERARRLPRERPGLHYVLAPLYAMALVGARPGLVVKAWAGTAAIAGAVVLVAALPPPWRGIVDFAVAAALTWGLGALLRQGFAVDPSAPGRDPGRSGRASGEDGR